MIRLPWVSREVMSGLLSANAALNLAVTQVISERDWLRAQLATALDHNRRLERIAAKVHEVPTQPRQPREPMPSDIRDGIDAWDSDTTRAQLEAEAHRRYERDGNWDGVRASLATAD